MATAISCHRSGHSFATHLLDRGQGIRMIQELLGHGDGRISMIHTHVLNMDRLARTVQPTLCNIANPYRRIRPLNPEWL